MTNSPAVLRKSIVTPSRDKLRLSLAYGDAQAHSLLFKIAAERVRITY